MLAKIKGATWSSPKIVGHSRSWSTITSKYRGQAKFYLKIANSEDHFSIKIVTETILSPNGLESHKIVTKIVPEDRDHAPFLDSRWSSVTRSWAKVIVLHKILIKIVRQNVPMIFATILVKNVLKIVNEDREWCCIHSCINIFNTWLNKFIRRRDWWINCGLLNLIGYLNQTRINWLDSIESTDFTF